MTTMFTSTASASAAPALQIRVRPLASAVRRSEWVVLTFLLYAQALALALPAAPAVQHRIWMWNSGLMLVYGMLLYCDAVKPSLWASVVRDWLPLAAVLLAYREMGWFAQPHATALLESRWIIWDRAFLQGGGKAAIEALGPLLPSVLEVSYALVYALAPFAIAMLYVSGRRRQVDRFLYVFVLGVLLCYAQFPFWPSEPPRVVFAGQDGPAYDTIFRRFNLWTLANAGIHTSVFPSAHVAGAFAAAFGLRQVLRRAWSSRLLLLMAILIAVATVYGRYHYLADAAAGLLMAGVASFAPGRGIEERR